MIWKRNKCKLYPCRHPEHKHYDAFMANLCRDLDDKILKSGKDEKEINKRTTIISKNSRTNK